MPTYYTTDTELTSVANAIRTRGKTTASLSFPVGYISAIEEIATPMDLDTMFINRTMTSYENSTITSIPKFAFDGFDFLSSINLPSCTNIGEYAFAQYYSLSQISLPVCQTIEGNAFANISALTSINLPSCTTIGSWAFSSCKNGYDILKDWEKVKLNIKRRWLDAYNKIGAKHLLSQ